MDLMTGLIIFGIVLAISLIVRIFFAIQERFSYPAQILVV